jgi:hypothetical protein
VTVIHENILRLMSKEDRKSYGKAGKTREEIVKEVGAKLEREIQSDVIAFLRQRGIEVICSRFGKRTTTKSGTPDLIFAVNGQAVAWELKTKDGTCSHEQEQMRDRLVANGWRWEVIRSVQEAKASLDKL